MRLQSRLVKDAEERLISDLQWAGLSWDEGPDRGGPYGPYRQVRNLMFSHRGDAVWLETKIIVV